MTKHDKMAQTALIDVTASPMTRMVVAQALCDFERETIERCAKELIARACTYEAGSACDVALRQATAAIRALADEN